MSGLSKSRMYRKITVGDKLRSTLKLITENIKSDYSISWKRGKKKSEDCFGFRAGWEWIQKNLANFLELWVVPVGFFSEGLQLYPQMNIKKESISHGKLVVFSVTLYFTMSKEGKWDFFFPDSLEGEPKHWLRCTWKNQVTSATYITEIRKQHLSPYTNTEL